MLRVNLTALWLWPLLAVFVVVLTSFDDPFRIALAAFMLAAQGPVWRLIHALDPAPVKSKNLRR